MGQSWEQLAESGRPLLKHVGALRLMLGKLVTSWCRGGIAGGARKRLSFESKSIHRHIQTFRRWLRKYWCLFHELVGPRPLDSPGVLLGWGGGWGGGVGHVFAFM